MSQTSVDQPVQKPFDTYAQESTEKRLIDAAQLCISVETLNTASFAQERFTNRFCDTIVERDYVVFSATYSPAFGGFTFFLLFGLSMSHLFVSNAVYTENPVYFVLRIISTGFCLASSVAHVVFYFISDAGNGSQSTLLNAQLREAIVTVGSILVGGSLGISQNPGNADCLYKRMGIMIEPYFTTRDSCARFVFIWGLLGIIIPVLLGTPRGFICWIITSIVFLLCCTSQTLESRPVEEPGDSAARLILLGLVFLAFTMAYHVYDRQRRRLFVQLVNSTRKVQRFGQSQSVVHSLTNFVLPPTIQRKLHQKQVTIDQADGTCIVIDVPVLPRSSFSTKMAASFALAAADIAECFDSCHVDRHTSGDWIIGTSNLVTPSKDHCDRVCHLAKQLMDAPFMAYVRVRIGISTGMLSGMVVDHAYIRYDIFGRPLQEAGDIVVQAMAGYAAVADHLCQHCHVTTFKCIKGHPLTLICESHFDPSTSSVAVSPSMSLGQSLLMTSFEQSNERAEADEAPLNASARNFQWTKLFLQEATLNRHLRAKLSGLAMQSRPFWVQESFVSSTSEMRLQKNRSLIDAESLRLLVVPFFLILCASIVITALQTSRQHHMHLDPSYGILLQTAAAVLSVFIGVWAWGRGKVTNSIVIAVSAAVALSEAGAGIMRPSTSSSSPIYLMYLNQLLLNSLAIRPPTVWIVLSGHIFFFVAMQYTNGYGLERVVDYYAIIIAWGASLIHEWMRRGRDRRAFVSSEIIEIMTNLEAEQQRLKQSVVRTVIPKPFVADALANRSSNILATTAYPQIIVGYFRFDCLANTLSENCYYDAAKVALRETTGVVEDLLREMTTIEPLSVRGDVVCVAGPLLRTSTTILRDDFLHQAVDEVIRIYEVVTDKRDGIFTIILECEQGTGVLAHTKYPIFFLTGTAMSNARALLRGAVAGAHVATASFASLCSGYASSVVSGRRTTWKLKGIGKVEVVTLKAVERNASPGFNDVSSSERSKSSRSKSKSSLSI